MMILEYLFQRAFYAMEDYWIFFPILLIMEICICRYYRKKNVRVTWGFKIGYQLFACYLLMVLSVTGGAAFDWILSYIDEFPRMCNINLIPFVGWRSDSIFGMLLNVLMMVPLGILLPLLWDKIRFKETILAGFVLSLLIELSQLFNWRATDIDDLILNTAGTAIGYGLYYLCLRKIHCFQAQTNCKKRICNSALLQVILIFFMRFFIGRPILGLILYHIYS